MDAKIFRLSKNVFFFSALAAFGINQGHGADFTWTSGVDGSNFSDDFNWTTTASGIPGTGDNVILDSTGLTDLTLDVNASIMDFTWSDRTLLSQFLSTTSLDVFGAFNWSGGTLDLFSGGGKLALNGESEVTGTVGWDSGEIGGTTSELQITSGGELKLGGAIGTKVFSLPRLEVASGGLITLGDSLQLANDADIDIFSGGMLDITEDKQITDVSGGSIINIQSGGSVVKSAGGGIATIGADVVNAGSFEIRAGTVNVTGTYNGNGGETDLFSGTTLILNGASSFDGVSSIIGAGTVDTPSVTLGTTFLDPVGDSSNEVGTLSFTGDVNFGSNTFLGIDFIDMGGTVDHDSLSIGGDAFLAGSLLLTADSDLRPLITSTDIFDIVELSTTDSMLTGEFTNLADGSQIALVQDLGEDSLMPIGVFDVHYDRDDFGIDGTGVRVYLSDFQAIPEPSTYLLMGLGLGVVFFYLRRRSSAN